MSGVRSGRVAKMKRRVKSRPVLRMMAIMQDGNNEEIPKEFVEGGRTGRRNAMPDILHPPEAHTTTADLPARLQQLATTECACHRNALPQLPSVQYHDAAVHVDPSVWSHRSSEDKLKELLEFGGSLLPGAVGGETVLPPGKDVATVVSESSWKYCCSQERLQGFLKSECAKRRCAVPNVTYTRWSSTSDPVRPENPTKSEKVKTRQRPIPDRHHICDVIRLNDAILRQMLGDPDNPQPGPSTSQPEQKTDEPQKKDSVS